jgi:hypothetical protein
MLWMGSRGQGLLAEKYKFKSYAGLSGMRCLSQSEYYYHYISGLRVNFYLSKYILAAM